ncbi:hypothetical protein D3C72_1928350 [compost metagenome]
MVDLLCAGARFQRPADMTVHCALGTDGRRGAKLHQLNGLLLQRASIAYGLAQRLHGIEIIRVLPSQALIGLEFCFIFHADFLMLDLHPNSPFGSGWGGLSQGSPLRQKMTGYGRTAGPARSWSRRALPKRVISATARRVASQARFPH